MSATPRDENKVGDSKDKLAGTSSEEKLWFAEGIHRNQRVVPECQKRFVLLDVDARCALCHLG